MDSFRKRLSHITFWLALVILPACGGGSDSPPPPATPQRGNVVSVTPSVTYDTTQLLTLSNSSGLFTAYQGSIAYAVNVHKVVYWTADHYGNVLRASGLLAIPQKTTGSSTALLSYQNGTIFHNSEAPTNYASFSMLAGLIASTNFIVTIPDYIGYGESVAELHTYMHAESLANATIDLLRAAQTYLASNNIGVNGQLFLAGYSEGGYASVATHKMLQENYASEFTVTATAAGAGAYDLRSTADTLLGGTTLPFAPYVAFVFKAYDEIYGFNRISDIFRSDYVDPINNYFYGAYNAIEINNALTNVTADLFSATFLSDYLSTGETQIKARLLENNVYDWAPQAPIRFYHGINDITVPYANSTTAQNRMAGNGASDVLVIDCPAVPADHGNCSQPYLNYMLGYFLTF